MTLAAALLVTLAGCGGDGASVPTDNSVIGAAETPDDASDEDDGPPVVSPTPAPGSTAVSLPPPPREGRWSIRDDGEGLTAVFGPPKGYGSLSVRCDAARRRLVFFRAAKPDSGRAVALHFFLPTGNTLLRAFPQGGDQPGYHGNMPLREPWLDTLMAAGGTLESDLDGREPLSVPVAPELKRVVAQCRRAQQGGAS